MTPRNFNISSFTLFLLSLLHEWLLQKNPSRRFLAQQLFAILFHLLKNL